MIPLDSPTEQTKAQRQPSDSAKAQSTTPQDPSKEQREKTQQSNRARGESQEPSKTQDRSSSKTSNAIGHYILGKSLGEGTFGKVKLGTHVLTGEKVAVKVLEKSKIKDKKDVERISREIKILKQLHHPNVVQIYEIIETEKDLYLVMEYASGGELFDMIVQNQKLKETKAAKYFQELIAGVHYIHKLGICHRDLKPENLLIDFDGSLKVVDFGLSNMYEQGSTLKTACGSPCYAAPEMIAGNRYHGLKSDIWSCGVVLYAMLCGFLPFEDQKTSNLYKKILSAEYSMPKFLSADAKDIIQKIFVTDPEKRITIEGLRSHPWYKSYQPENQNFDFHGQELKINPKLLNKLESSLGFSQESVERAVKNNKHNHLSATYYLLLKKYACQNFKYQHQQQLSATQPIKSENLKTEEIKSSIQSTRPTSQQRADSEPRKSIKVTEATKKQSRAKKPSEMGRMPAPVQDPLVLKNHRREQSATATAGRHKDSSGWGDVRDERRTESYERPAIDEDYAIVVSKAQRYLDEQDKQRVNPKQQPKQSNELRIQYMSPSPDNYKAPQSTQNASQPVRKSSTVAQSTQQTTAHHSIERSVIQPAQERERKKEPAIEPINIQNIKQQAITQARPASATRSGSQVAQKQRSGQSQERPKTTTVVDNKASLSNTIQSDARTKAQPVRPTSAYRSNHTGRDHPTQRSTDKKLCGKDSKSYSTTHGRSQERTSSANPGHRTSTDYDRKSGTTPLAHATISTSNSNSKLSQTLWVSQQSRPQSGSRKSGSDRLQSNKEFLEQANEISNLISSLNMSGIQVPYASRAQTASAISGEHFHGSNSKLPSFLDQLLNKQNLQRQLAQPPTTTSSGHPGQPFKSVHSVDMASSTSVHKAQGSVMLVDDLVPEPRPQTKGSQSFAPMQKSGSTKEKKPTERSGNTTQILDMSGVLKSINEDLNGAKKSSNQINALFASQPLASQLANINKELRSIQLTQGNEVGPTYIKTDFDVDQGSVNNLSAKNIGSKRYANQTLTTKSSAQRSSSTQPKAVSKTTTSTKHTRNHPILISQHSGGQQQLSSFVSDGQQPVSAGQPNYVIPTSDQRHNQQRSHSINTAGYRSQEGTLTPSTQHREEKFINSFESTNGQQQKDRRASQGPTHQQHHSVGVVSHLNGAIAQNTKRSGSVANHANTRSTERSKKLEVPAYDHRFQSINLDTDNEIFRLVDTEQTLSQSMYGPSSGPKLKSQTQTQRRKQQVNSITELLNQTQPVGDIRSIQLKTSVPDDKFLVQTNNYFKTAPQTSSGAPQKQSAVLAQELGLNTSFDPRRGEKSGQSTLLQSSMIIKAETSKLSSNENLHAPSKQSSATYQQQQNYLNELLQSNNLNFHQPPAKPSSSYQSQNRYVGNTSGLFSPNRAKSVGPAQKSQALQPEMSYQPVASPHNMLYQPQQNLNLAQGRPDLYAHQSNVGYQAEQVSYQPQPTSFMPLASNLNSLFYNHPPSYQRPGGVVPQPLPSSQPVYPSYQVKSSENFYQGYDQYSVPHWANTQVPTHYQMYNQQLIQQTNYANQSGRMDKAKAQESPINKSTFTSKGQSMKYPGQSSLSKSMADHQYAQAVALQRSQQLK